ncbi:MAG: ATPase [Prolixibacteraceae bacterium]|jgi:glucosamine kinase|nr:ATPase [Prolixibacteraceae bacterium]MBT6007492.1 ATPase [Prolixibacteraceae bacterium]MBT6998720.1 ATPase [Prolixibacteraceae bacterium]MBT7395320.1 ATPase [Prolixibacteraceae bacterium]
MILIADSGSTKTTWFYSGVTIGNELITTQGINPFFRTADNIILELKESLVPQLKGQVEQIFFYGAGIINKEKANVVSLALNRLFPDSEVEVQSDLIAAARATLGNEPGIACILGTGCNSGLYNGSEITAHVPPLGFILGDEGSGAVLGRKLLADFLKGIMPENLSRQFKKQYPFEYPDFLEKVYRQEKPNKFLAQFVPFIKENINEEYCRLIVENSFDEFVTRNISRYSDFAKQKICFVGSVAFHFQKQLKDVLIRNNLKLEFVLKEPMEGLKRFHTKF